MKRLIKSTSIILIFTIVFVTSSYSFADNDMLPKDLQPIENNQVPQDSSNSKVEIRPNSLSIGTIAAVVGLVSAGIAFGKGMYGAGKYAARKAIAHGYITRSTFKSSSTLRNLLRHHFITTFGNEFGSLIYLGFFDEMYGV